MFPPPVLKSRILQGAGFAHGFSTRASGDFATLRDPATLRSNQERLAVDVGFAVDRLFQATQVHGDTIIDAGGDLSLEADGLVAHAGTKDAVGIRVADCVPVLLASKDGSVAAVHAGWRGVVNGILGNAIARIKPAYAAIGPHIGPCCFEVGPEVAAQIGFVDRVVGDKSFVDLRKAVRAQLSDIDVDDVGECTKCNPARYHSYRRDGDASGRLIAVIAAR